MKKALTQIKAKRRKPKAAHQKANCKSAIETTLKDLDQIKPKTEKAAAVIALLRSWLNDESGYDEQTWPKLKKTLNEERDWVGARSVVND
jgi:hypothetical protein